MILGGLGADAYFAMEDREDQEPRLMPPVHSPMRFQPIAV
jgi:hypothetical protein